MRRHQTLLLVEVLETRWVPAGPPIDFFTVALHELGHSLGLGHSNSPACGSAAQPVMCPYYIGPVTHLEQEDIDRVNAVYPESLGDAPANGRWDVENANGSARAITFSYVPAGTRMDQGGKSTTIPSWWHADIDAALAEWTRAADANGTAIQLTFASVADSGKKFNLCDGFTQGSPNFGDIRFAAHRFDGPGNVLAHAYYPPPNGCSAASDAHFDQAENWIGSSLASSSATHGKGSKAGESLTLAAALPVAAFVVPEATSAASTANDAAPENLTTSDAAEQSRANKPIADHSADAAQPASEVVMTLRFAARDEHTREIVLNNPLQVSDFIADSFSDVLLG